MDSSNLVWKKIFCALFSLFFPILTFYIICIICIVLTNSGKCSICLYFVFEYSRYKHFLFVYPHYLFTPGKKVKHLFIKDFFSERQGENFLILIIDAGPVGWMNKIFASCSGGFMANISVWVLKVSSACLLEVFSRFF